MYDATTYWVRVTGQALGASKKKQTPEFSLRVLVLGKVNPADPGGALLSCDQYERTIRFYFTDKSAEIAIEQLQKLGFDRSSFRLLDPNVEGFHDFTGIEFEAYCKHERYEGRDQEKWSVSRGKSPMQVEALPADGIRKLDAMFGKKLKAAAKPASRPTATKPLDDPNTDLQEAAAEAGEDDIPF